MIQSDPDPETTVDRLIRSLQDHPSQGDAVLVKRELEALTEQLSAAQSKCNCLQRRHEVAQSVLRDE